MNFDPKKSQKTQGTMIAIIVLGMLAVMIPLFAMM
jgi:hypothetical protein